MLHEHHHIAAYCHSRTCDHLWVAEYAPYIHPPQRPDVRPIHTLYGTRPLINQLAVHVYRSAMKHQPNVHTHSYTETQPDTRGCVACVHLHTARTREHPSTSAPKLHTGATSVVNSSLQPAAVILQLPRACFLLQRQLDAKPHAPARTCHRPAAATATCRCRRCYCSCRTLPSAAVPGKTVSKHKLDIYDALLMLLVLLRA